MVLKSDFCIHKSQDGADGQLAGLITRRPWVRIPLLLLETMAKTTNKTMILSDESVNTCGFWIPAEEYILDRFNGNPIMLYNHHESTGKTDDILPIGLWENIRIEGPRLLADRNIDEEDSFAVKIGKKLEKGILRAVSVGIRIREFDWESLKDGCPAARGVAIREASICDIPANPNALSVVLYDQNDNLVKLSADGKLPAALFDNNKPQKQTMDFKLIARSLGLSEAAAESDVLSEVQKLRTAADLTESLKADNQTLKNAKQEAEKELKAFKDAQATALKDEAKALLAAAQKDGRLDAVTLPTYEKLFDANHDAAKAALGALPARQSMISRTQRTATGGITGSTDKYANLSWAELDKGNMLTALKDENPDLFARKFEEEFHTKYNPE